MPNTQFGPEGWTPDQLGDLTGQKYLITGANAGTGFEMTRALLSKGATVVMLSRSKERSDAAIKNLKSEFGDDAQVSFIEMDLSDLMSVRRAAAQVRKIMRKIDVLICNAAIAQVPKREVTSEGFESQLATNHYGHFLLCGMLFENIEAAKGRIVVVASLGYKMGLRAINFDDMNWERKYGANTAYSQSRLAQMMFAYELQDRAKAAGKSVQVYVCHPGSSATSPITTSAGAFTRFAWWLMRKSPMVQTAEQGAYPALMCATETGLEQRALYGPTGRMEFVGPVGKGTLEPFAHEKSSMTKLWDITQDVVKFKWHI